jgi:anti-sigma factor RsiW
MICEQAQELISGLVDNELTVEERRAIDAHLKDCRNCQVTYRNEIALKQRLRAAGASLEVPADLREEIRALADKRGRGLAWVGGRARSLGWLSLAGFRPAIAWAVVAVVIAPLIYVWWPTPNVSLAALETHEKILGGKVTFLKAENLVDMQKQMVHAVESRFTPMNYDLSMSKLRPVAGLVQKIAGRKVLVVSYQGENFAITCYTLFGTEKDAPDDAKLYFDAAKKIEFRTFSRDGINGVLHREGEIICILVSKMPMPELLTLARAKARPA